MLGGPLSASDPGCGTAELYSVLVSTVQYGTVQYSTVPTQDGHAPLADLLGTAYPGLAAWSGAEDPYTLVPPRHLPQVMRADIVVSRTLPTLQHWVAVFCKLSRSWSLS